MSSFKDIKIDFKSKSIMINMNLIEKHLGMCSLVCDSVEKTIQRATSKQVEILATPDHIIDVTMMAIRYTQIYGNKHWQRRSFINIQTVRQ